MEIIKNFFISLLISIPIIFVGYLYDDWGSKRGYFRSSKSPIAIGTIILFIAKPFMFPSTSWWVYSFIMLIGATLGVHEFDRRETWYKGTFWWKREESMKKHKRKKRIENNNTSTHNKTRLSAKQKNYIKFLREKSQKKQRAKYSD